jgi:uncharacterized protein (TIGR02147 family)
MTLTKTRLKDIVRSLNVTDHQDYRDFLSLIYSACKAEDNSYSYIRFSTDIGVGSTNSHSLIVGRRNLTIKAAEKICQALGMTGVQKRYFLNLVEQKRAKSTGARDAVFEERLALRQRLLPTELDKRQLAFFEHWYHAAILEVLRLDFAKDDSAWLANQLMPSIAQSKVEESLELLKNLGYLQFDAQRGRLYPTDVTITTGNQIAGMAIASFHRQMVKLALAAIDDISADDRDITSVTLMATPNMIELMKDDLAMLRKKFLAMAASESDANEVVQLNLQLFPLMKKGGDK